MTLNSATAGILVMKNGDRITGTVKKIWDGDVFIGPDYSDEFIVDQSAVAYIVDDRKMTVEMKDGAELVGQIGVNSDGQQVIFVDGDEILLPMTALAELKEPEAFSDWEVRFDATTSLNKGNTNSQDNQLNLYAMYKRGKQRHILDALADNQEQDGVSTKERDFVQYNFNYEVNEPWFFGTSASYERDPIKNQKYRYNIVPALGYDIFNTANRILTLQVGAGYQAEESIDQTGPGAVADDGGVAAFIMRFRWDFGSPDLELYVTNQTTAAFYGRKNISTQWVTGLRFAITDLLYLNTEFNYNREREPLDGAQPEDLSLLFGFGMAFD